MTGVILIDFFENRDKNAFEEQDLRTYLAEASEESELEEERWSSGVDETFSNSGSDQEEGGKGKSKKSKKDKKDKKKKEKKEKKKKMKKMKKERKKIVSLH